MPVPERPGDKDDLEGRVVLTEQDAREAARLLRLLSDALGRPAVSAGNDDRPGTDQLASRARIIFHSRRARSAHFNRAMFGEPAWDILLLLYVHHPDGGRLTASKIAELIEEPFSTVVRWIDYLEKERLIERIQHPTDKRVFIIRLLAKARMAIENYLSTTPLPNSGEA